MNVKKIKVVDRYVGLSALQGVALVWVSLILLFAATLLLRELRSGHNEYGAFEAVWFVVLTIPRMAYQSFPFAVLLGTLVGVGNLSASNELLAFRVSGVSRLRLALAALLGALLLMIPVMYLAESIAPKSEQAARSYKFSKILGTAVSGRSEAIWLRDGIGFIKVEQPLLIDRGKEQAVELHQISIYEFAADHALNSVTRADQMYHDGENWLLKNAITDRFGQSSIDREESSVTQWKTAIEPGLIKTSITRPYSLSLAKLWTYLKYLEKNNLDNSVYLDAYWEKLTFPLTTAAMVFLAMPFVFVRGRVGNLGMRLFLGAALGFVFFVVDNLVQPLGAVSATNAFLSHSILPLVLVGVSTLMLRRSA